MIFVVVFLINGEKKKIVRKTGKFTALTVTLFSIRLKIIEFHLNTFWWAIEPKMGKTMRSEEIRVTGQKNIFEYKITFILIDGHDAFFSTRLTFNRSDGSKFNMIYATGNPRKTVLKSLNAYVHGFTITPPHTINLNARKVYLMYVKVSKPCITCCFFFFYNFDPEGKLEICLCFRSNSLPYIVVDVSYFIEIEIRAKLLLKIGHSL